MKTITITEHLERIPRIAVCDDAPNIHEQIYRLILDYNRLHPQEQMYFNAFSDGNSLLDYNEIIDLLFLDIELGETSGVELVPVLQKKYPDVTIMFISSHTKYFIYSHRLNVFQFLTKPFDERIFFEELDRFYERYHRSQDLYTVEYRGRTVQFPIQEIVYIEAELRHLKIHHSKTGVYEMTGQIGREEKRLKEYGFIRCHHGYLVNARYIEVLKSQEIILNTASPAKPDELLTLPVSKGKTQQVRQQYQQWLQQQRS